MEVLNESVKVLRYPPLLHKKNKIYYWGDVLYCVLAYGALPEDYVSLKFYEKSRKERGKYVTAGNKRLFYKKFYDDEARKTLANKSLFSKKFHEFVKRDWLYTPDVAIDEVEAFVRRHGKVIVKSNSSTWGMGISVVDATKMEELLNEIRNGKQFMIEEVLENHPDVGKLNPSSLQTLRVETCIDAEGEFHLLNVLLMMGTTKTIVSNCHSGGIMCHVDIKTGKIAYQLNKPYNYYLYQIFSQSGAFTWKLIFLVPTAIIMGLLLLGPIQNYSWTFVLPTLICMLLAVFLTCIIYGTVGLLTFWLEEATPFTWIIQKFQMLLGLFFPPEFFPTWLQPVIVYSPIYAMISGPCKLMANFSWELFAQVFISQISYITIFVMLGTIIYKTGAKKVNVHGG